MKWEDAESGGADTPVDEAEGDEANAALRTWLAEFRALRAEMVFRMRQADTMAFGTITGIGILLAVGLSSFPPVFLILPLLNTIFMYAYLNQLRIVGVIGGYIRERIVPAVRNLSNDRLVFGWEMYRARSPNWQVVQWVRMPHAGIITMTSIFALVFSFTEKTFATPENTTVWIIDSFLTVFGLIIWVREELRLRLSESVAASVDQEASPAILANHLDKES